MSIKIAHISDLHLDERGRLDDVTEVLGAFLRQASEQHVQLILLSGDNFERRSTPRERLEFARFLQRASEIAPVFGVKGNHEVAGDLDVFNLIKTENFVYILDRPTTMPGSAIGWNSRGKHFGLLALPWFEKSNLVAGLDATVDAEQTRQLTIDAAGDLLTCLRAEATRLRNEGTIPILVAHVLVAGSEVSTGQTLIGTTVELTPHGLLEVEAVYVALGHIHKSQKWFDGRIAYAGSPSRCNFGEQEPKGWCLVTLSDIGEFVSNDFIKLPARRIVLLETDWSKKNAVKRLRENGIAPEIEGLKSIKGTLVRFRYRIHSKDLHLVDEHAIEQIFLAEGAEKVKIECIIEHYAHARAPEIVTLHSTSEKLDAYFRVKDIEVNEYEHDRIHAKLSALEKGARHETQ